MQRAWPPLDFSPCPVADDRFVGIAKLRALSDDR
jgi:hypothetical protein